MQTAPPVRESTLSYAFYNRNLVSSVPISGLAVQRALKGVRMATIIVTTGKRMIAKAQRMNNVTEISSLTPQARATSVVALLREAGPEIEANCELPAHVLQALHEARLFRITLPRAVGGEAIDLRTFGEVIEIIAGADASTGWVMSQGGGCAMAAAFMEPAAAKRIFGPSNAVLAWGAGVQGKAIKCDGGYRVTGKWQFASGSRHATVLGGHSYVFEADGVTQCFHPDGRKVDRTAIFARAKAKVHDVWNTMGLCGTGSDTFEVNDLFVPWDETVDREDKSALTDSSPLYLINTSLVYAVGFSSLQVGIARAMLEELRTLAMDKRPRGAAASLRDSAVFQGQLAQFEAKLRMIRASILFVADEVYANAARTGKPIDMDDRVALRLACTNAINEAVAVSTDIYRAAGATAIFPSNPFERRLRDALTASQQVQARADHYENVGRYLLGLPPNSTMFL